MNLKDRSKRISALINNPYGRSIAASNESELGLPGGSQDAMTASKEIDLWLLEGKKELDRRRNGVKILLLGNSLSAHFQFPSLTKVRHRAIGIRKGLFDFSLRKVYSYIRSFCSPRVLSSRVRCPSTRTLYMTLNVASHQTSN